MPLPGSWLAIKSAARRKAPVPPGDWVALARLALAPQSQRPIPSAERHRHKRVHRGANVGFGGFILEQASFCFLDGAHDRRVASGVAVYTNTKVHFLRVGIF